MSGATRWNSADPEVGARLFGAANPAVHAVHAVRMMDAMVSYAVQRLQPHGGTEQPVPEQMWHPQGEFCLEDFILASDTQLQYLTYKSPTAILLPQWVSRWARLGVLRRNCASELVLLPPWRSAAGPWFALGVGGGTGTRPHDRVEALLPETWRRVAFLWCDTPMAAQPRGDFLAPNEIEDAHDR